jgi:hypothetical protein
VENVLPAIVLAIGFAARLIPAARNFLNPDEALHNLLASQTTIRQAWAAALTNAHPPLLILILYYWRALGQSELWLRMPSVLAGTAACWFFYRWLRLVTDRTTAFFGLLLVSFAPSLILLSAEIRQYALLLFFMTACLHISELALQKNSPRLMALFSVSLYGALLTHYSALIFACAIGIYLLVRLYPFRERLGLFAVWAAGQIGGVAIAAYFLVTHVSRLRQTGMVRADLESYLRKSTFHAGERNPVEFVAAQTLRVFTYVVSHGLVGALMLLAFLAGVFYLVRLKEWRNDEGLKHGVARPSPRQLALLIAIPFVANWGIALAGLYPVGATRHSSYLAPFAIAGAAVGIAAVVPAAGWSKSVAILACMAVCNLFPAPPPPIRAQDQSRALMKSAVAELRASVTPGSVLLADYESGLLLGYYVCPQGVVRIFPSAEAFATADCGAYRVLSPSFREWKFVADTFPGEFASASKMLGGRTQEPAGSTEVWLFYSGWINDSAPAMKKELADFGCTAPKNFGENIFFCRLKASEDLSKRKGPPSAEGSPGY